MTKEGRLENVNKDKRNHAKITSPDKSNYLDKAQAYAIVAN